MKKEPNHRSFCNEQLPVPDRIHRAALLGQDFDFCWPTARPSAARAQDRRASRGGSEGDFEIRFAAKTTSNSTPPFHQPRSETRPGILRSI